MKKTLLIILASIIAISVTGCEEKAIPTKANVSSENSSPSSIIEIIPSGDLSSESISCESPIIESSRQVSKPVESKEVIIPAPVSSKEIPKLVSSTPIPLPASSLVVIQEKPLVIEPISSDIPVVNENNLQIYVTPTGKKYHYKNPCGRGTYTPSTLDQALNMGLEPCGKCVLK